MTMVSSFKINIENLFICDSFLPLLSHLTLSDLRSDNSMNCTIKVITLYFNSYYAEIYLSPI